MEASQDFKIEIEKTFPVSKERLYQAWINAEDLKKWWVPLKGQLSEVENEVHEGGKIKYSFDSDQVKGVLVITGEYLEVQENEKLVYTWNWETSESSLGEGKYKLHVLFKEQDEGSTISIKQENTVSEETLLPHKAGWEKSLNDFSNYLSEERKSEQTEDLKENQSAHSEEGGKTDGAGYNELPEQQKVGE